MKNKTYLAFCLFAALFVSFFSRVTDAYAADNFYSGLRLSLGQSIYLVEPRVDLNAGCSPCYDGNRRMPLDLEVLPYLRFKIVSVDLGLLVSFESRNDMGFTLAIRPGVRVYPIAGLYVRVSVPLAIMQLGLGYAYVQANASVGLGYEVSIGKWGLFGEFALNPGLRTPFTMPMEFRLGFSIHT